MVDKLLKKLKERGSRVLIFTQMTRYVQWPLFT
jgi:SNF2 family DNA or RNA helicase